MNELSCIETVEYCTAMKRKKLQMHTTPGVTCTILSIRSKTLKITSGIVPFIKVQSSNGMALFRDPYTRLKL